MKVVLLFVVFVWLALLTHRRVEVWQSTERVFTDAVQRAPCLPRPHAVLAQRAEQRGDPVRALAEWQTAVRLAIDPCGS